ncbi:MAG: hypothetical protein RPU13_13495 [Candidatus Sedimenticola sp. (ex Thyasira tokunagai)]
MNSQQTTAASPTEEQARIFLDAWRVAIHLTEHPKLFGGNPAAGLNGFAPKVKEIARALPTLPKSQSALIAALVSFYNPEEGAKMMTKVGICGLGALSLAIKEPARAALADLIYSYQGW